MNNLMTLEAMMIVNGLSIQHSSEWEDYVAMNARLHGLTEEEWMAYYGSDDITTESLSQLLEKKVTRKQLDKALNDLAKITNDLKKVVKEWAAARDAGKTEEQAKKLEELKKLNDEKTAAQKVVDSHIQQLDKNVELETSESVNEKKSEFKEGDKVKLTLKGLQQMNRHRTPGISNDYSRSLGKIRDKDIAGTVERVFPSGSMNVRFDGVLYDIKDYMVVKESVNEAVSRSTKIYCVATPAPKKELVEELKDIFGDDYRNIVTEFTDDEGYESVLLFNLTRNDIALIQKRVADVLIWEYSIKKGREIMESLNEKIKVASLADAIEAEQDGDLNKKHLDKILKRKEDGTIHQMTRSEEKTYHAILRKYKIQEAIDIDMINTEYGFWGTMDQYYTYRSIETAFEEAMNYLIGSYNFTQQAAYNFLNSKWGRKLADEYHDGVYSIINTIDDFGNKSTWKKYAKMFNENADVEFAFDIFEGIMSNLHQMADEIGDEDKFVKAFFSEYGDKIKKSSDSEEWVRSLYKDTVKENIDTMKKLQTLENFNEAAPRMSDSAETQNLLNLRDEIANAQKGGSEGRYGKDFEKAKVKALRAIEQMITYTKIGV